MTNSLSHNNNRDVNLPNISDNNASATLSTSAIPNAIKKGYRRSQHVKVLKNCRQNSTRRQCLKCKESSSNVEMLKSKVCQIEKLVDAIAETAQNMKNYSQRDNQPRKWKFGGIDLTNSSLEEIQNLVLETTSKIKIPPPSSSSNSGAKDISNTSIEPSSSPTTTRKKIIDLPSAASSSQLITKKPLHSEPVQSIEEEGSTHPSHRNCRILPSYLPSNHENQASRQDSGFSESRQITDPKVHHHYHHHQHYHQNKQQQDHN